MTISGTHNIQDALTDLTIPLEMEQQTNRYKEAEKMYLKYKPQHIISHSLGSRIALDLQNKYKDNTTRFDIYNAPIIEASNALPSNVHDHSKHGDIISMFDSSAKRKGGYILNPFLAHSYK